MNQLFRQKRIRIIPVAVAALILIGLILLLIFFPYSGSIRYEIVSDGLNLKGVILRSEQVVDLSQYDKLTFENIVDGAFLKKGDKIVTAYKKGYLKTSLDKLHETEKSIVAYQNQSVITGYDDRRIVQYDFEIEVLIRRMSEEKDGNIALYHRLRTVMRDREAYIRTEYNTDSNTYLQGLYRDEEQLTESLRVWRDELTAPETGYMGYYCDEAEASCQAEEMLKYQTLKDAVKQERKPMQKVFKTVTSETWYIAVPVEKTDAFETDKSYPVYIGESRESETAYLQSIITEKRGAVLLFRLEEHVSRYLDSFVTDVFVGQRVEGFTVPNRYVQSGQIRIKDENGKKSIPVEVLYQNNDQTVFAVNDECRVGTKVYR